MSDETKRKWMNDLTEDDHYDADVLVGRATREFKKFIEPMRMKVLHLSLKNRKLRERLDAVKLAAMADKRELHARIRELKAEARKQWGWT